MTQEQQANLRAARQMDASDLRAVRQRVTWRVWQQAQREAIIIGAAAEPVFLNMIHRPDRRWPERRVSLDRRVSDTNALAGRDILNPTERRWHKRRQA